MKRNDRFFSRSRKKDTPVSQEMPVTAEAPAVEMPAPAAETVVVGHALLFTGAPEAMPIVDDQLFLSVPPQGGLVISPQCVGEPLLVIWKSGEDWLARRLWQGKLLLNGIETVGVLYGFGDRAELEQAGAAAIAETVDDLRKILLG